MVILRVGDPHIKINNLEDSEKLVQFALDQARALKVDRIEFLGDLFHTHAIVRVEILEFWIKWLRAFSAEFETVVLVGNHDQVGNYESKQHALSAFKMMNIPNLLIVDEPRQLGKIGYLPYIHNEEEFTKAANILALSATVLVCHATFAGSIFENGFYAPEGFNPDNINIPTIISGHIHKRQRFGKVIYPGTAKWDTNSDANEEKGLWLCTHDDNGAIVSERFIDTSGVCNPIFSIEWKEGTEQPQIPAGRVTLELIGSSEWIKVQKEKLKGKCGLKAKITDKARPERRNTGKGLMEFISSNFDPIAGVSRDQIAEFMKENGLV